MPIPITRVGRLRSRARQVGRWVSTPTTLRIWPKGDHRHATNPSGWGECSTGWEAESFEPVPLGERFTDGQLLPVSGGLRVIHTPGHSPGHVAFHHEPSGVLITGDSIFNVLGMRWSVASFCTDFAMSKETAQRLMEVDYPVAAFTHGPEIRDNPRQAIGAFLAKHGL